MLWVIHLTLLFLLSIVTMERVQTSNLDSFNPSQITEVDVTAEHKRGLHPRQPAACHIDSARSDDHLEIREFDGG